MGILLFIGGIIDYRYRRISNLLIIAMVIYTLFFSRVVLFERLCGIAVAIPLFILAIASNKIKGGDLKFLIVCAAALGMNIFVRILFLSVIAAVIWSILTRESSVPLVFVFMIGYIAYYSLALLGGFY